MPSKGVTRLVFDLSGSVKHRAFKLENPSRIVVDLDGVNTQFKSTGIDFSLGAVKGIRSAIKAKDQLRIVLDLRHKSEKKSYLLEPSDKYGYRLVVELNGGENGGDETVITAKKYQKGARDIIVAIDAGHGGIDPGAIGKNVQEKQVTLEVARMIKSLVDKQHGMQGFLVRDNDQFIPLRKRTQIARDHKADLFLSIHADSFRDHRAKGASVYTLSLRGATSEHAKMLAKKENAADLIGGINISEKDDILASVLLDLTQTHSMEASIDVAGQILKGLKKVGPLHKKQVEQAGFMVLKSPDIPSILIELAFISNPKDEQRLRSTKYQKEMSQAVVKGVKAYFKNYPPAGTILAQNQSRRHKISRGDTLSEIADSYQVSMKSIRKVNKLKGSMLRIGQVLEIPGS